MPRRLTDEQFRRLLGNRTKSDLIDWLMERMAEIDELRSAALNFVAPEADAKMLLSELRRIITRAWERTRSSREPWKLARPIASDLDPVLPALEQLIERGRAVEAEKVLRRYVEAAEKGLNAVDDSYGLLGPMCQDAVRVWGRSWAAIDDREPAELAKMVFAEVQINGFGLKDRMIGDFADALGREGLLALRELFETQCEESRPSGTQTNNWDYRRSLRHIAEVADALGDVDYYIDVQRRNDLVQIHALPIARRLFDAGRAEEALAYLDRADSHRSYFDGEVDYRTLRSRILMALGREEEVRELHWQYFQSNLDSGALDRYLEMVPDDRRTAVMQKAFGIAEAHRNPLIAAKFLVDRGQVEKAATLIVEHPDALEGRFYGTLLSLAESLQENYPTATWELYRALLLDILEGKRSKAYGHAADYLQIAEDLANRAGRLDKQEQLKVLLRARHGRKYSFWNRVKIAMPE